MPTNDGHIVWDSLLDNKYAVEVTRTAPYRGELTIKEGKTILHRKPVRLSFDALFGPDVADVAEWQQIAINFVDKLQRS